MLALPSCDKRGARTWTEGPAVDEEKLSNEQRIVPCVRGG